MLVLVMKPSNFYTPRMLYPSTQNINHASPLLSIQLQPLKQPINLPKQNLIINRILRRLVARKLAIQRAHRAAQHVRRIGVRLIFGRRARRDVDAFVLLEGRGSKGALRDVYGLAGVTVSVSVHHFVDAGAFEAQAEALGEVVADAVFGLLAGFEARHIRAVIAQKRR